MLRGPATSSSTRTHHGLVSVTQAMRCEAVAIGSQQASARSLAPRPRPGCPAVTDERPCPCTPHDRWVLDSVIGRPASAEGNRPANCTLLDCIA